MDQHQCIYLLSSVVCIYCTQIKLYIDRNRIVYHQDFLILLCCKCKLQGVQKKRQCLLNSLLNWEKLLHFSWDTLFLCDATHVFSMILLNWITCKVSWSSVHLRSWRMKTRSQCCWCSGSCKSSSWSWKYQNVICFIRILWIDCVQLLVDKMSWFQTLSQ